MHNCKEIGCPYTVGCDKSKAAECLSFVDEDVELLREFLGEEDFAKLECTVMISEPLSVVFSMYDNTSDLLIVTFNWESAQDGFEFWEEKFERFQDFLLKRNSGNNKEENITEEKPVKYRWQDACGSDDKAKQRSGKVMLELFPLEAMEACTKQLMVGLAKGYDKHGWRKHDLDEDELFAALVRHYIEHKKGVKEQNDANLPPIYGVLSNAIMMAVRWMDKNE